ncbi:Gfo/Idh/MocA family protein [Propionicicella superfundia]|uniref:Gfo/Idh/MocA family protein n=1 Tax=Propionicicella superfundia TaxID=348582 RepID=UPI001FE1AF5E|nr:Gfo/Idh/MocA family oxidoreductase [Propionicicella superfundia]
MTTSPLRVGIIGLGRIGEAHARTLLDQAGTGTLLLADADPARAQLLAAALDAEACALTDILSRVDAVVISTPTSTHAELLVAAARAGVPAFCEKPVALDVPTTRRVGEVVATAGTPVQIGFQRRFDTGYAAAREAVRAGRLGEVRRVHMVTCDPTPPPAEFVPTSGGIFKDCGIHDVDALRWITGTEVRTVFAQGVARGAGYFGDAGDSSEAVAVLTMSDGGLATLHLSRYNGQGYDVRMEVAGTQGTVVAGLDAHSALLSAEPGVTFPDGEPHGWFYPRFQAAYSAELVAFLDVAAGLATSPASIADALEALYVCEALALSRDLGRPVDVDEIRSR